MLWNVDGGASAHFNILAIAGGSGVDNDVALSVYA